MREQHSTRDNSEIMSANNTRRVRDVHCKNTVSEIFVGILCRFRMLYEQHIFFKKAKIYKAIKEYKVIRGKTFLFSVHICK
jgi:hypothetical protein